MSPIESLASFDRGTRSLSAQRSAAAERHDPPLVVRRFVTERAFRLDALLSEVSRRLAGTPASAERAFWHGGIHVNGQPLDPESPPTELPGAAWVVVYAFVREPEPVAVGHSELLFDAEGIVAVDKPPWLPMQRTRASARLSLESSLRALLGDASLVAAHRLDRQTSGVALFARGREGAWAAREFAARRVAKRYLAIVAPAPDRERFAVDGWIGRAPDAARFRFGLHTHETAGARWSRSVFQQLAQGAGRALLEVRPETGRTHQIRVHLAATGAAVVGDDLYGPRFVAGAASAAARVLLHAAELTLSAPNAEALRIEAPAPPDVANALV